MQVEQNNTTGSTVIGEAINVITSGQINFRSVGGNPLEQYYHEIKEVVYKFDPESSIFNNTIASNLTHVDSSSGAVVNDEILINRPWTYIHSREKWVATLVHEMQHESKEVDAIAIGLAEDIRSPTGANSAQMVTIKQLFEELTIRSRMEGLAADNPGLVDAYNQFPNTAAGIRRVVVNYNKAFVEGGSTSVTNAQVDAIVERIMEVQQSQVPSGTGSTGSTGSTGGGSGIGGFLSSVGQAIERAVTAVAEAIGNVFESIASFISGGSATAPASPIILDLDSDGIETSIRTNGASFDFDGDGYREAGAWVGKDDGLLVLDHHAKRTRGQLSLARKRQHMPSSQEILLKIRRSLRISLVANVAGICILTASFPTMLLSDEIATTSQDNEGYSSDSDIFAGFNEICLVGRNIGGIETAVGRCETNDVSGIYGVTTAGCNLLLPSTDFVGLQVKYEYEYECRPTNSAWRIVIRDLADPNFDSMVFSVD